MTIFSCGTAPSWFSLVYTAVALSHSFESLDNFYAKQHEDGAICREINTIDGTDCFSPFDPDGTGPNILAWAEWRHYRISGDENRLPEIFWPLLAYHRWVRANRSWPSGLYWATGLSSGMDNQPRVPERWAPSPALLMDWCYCASGDQLYCSGTDCRPAW